MTTRWNRLPILAAALLGLFCLVHVPVSTGKSAGATTQPVFLAPDSINLRKLLGDPPADNSTEQKAEIQTLLNWQESGRRPKVARCESEVASSPFTFAEVIGPWFTAETLPVTAAMFDEVNSETRARLNAAKKEWSRVRPFKFDKHLHPCVVAETTPSYPSGHATRGIVWGTILSKIFPDQRSALMAMGKRIGDDRVIAGMHYPSDVAAGQTLGAEIARQMLASPEMTAALRQARAECQKFGGAKAGK